MDGIVQNIDSKIIDEYCIEFLRQTNPQTDNDINPGGYYKAIWARDAAFILLDQFLTGDLRTAVKQIAMIWSHQIGTEASPAVLEFSKAKGKPLLYGRGSPELDFRSNIVEENTLIRFEGALPTTIYYEKGFCEIYGQNPDIDSTALMIHATSWILSKSMDIQKESNNTDKLSHNISVKTRDVNPTDRKGPFFENSFSDLSTYLIPRMLKAVKYLQSRDVDGDGLLEQKHNEDWMDTLLRTGKVVYSQACWILALKSLSNLLLKVGDQSNAMKIKEMAQRAILAVEQILWSEDDQCYVDLLDADLHLDEKMHNRFVTQDISLYLVALTEGSDETSFKEDGQIHGKKTQVHEKVIDSESVNRALRTLDSLKKRIWKNEIPLVTEREITKTGPWVLKANEYHNHTFWAWITGIEMISRYRYGKIEDFQSLFSKFISPNKINQNMLHEWVNPITFDGKGAYPFKTGISSIRLAAWDHICKQGLKSSAD
ncbi:GH116 family glycosyl hydrolase [Candidatus Nitrosocosmicus franklandus]|uniref:Glycosyl-hydrolase family 116 catalytic region domain-containing protein n=1 Tax=Candidatus Nitrosocosmicus franklandianus TaxID=1798806 RepID=A0A484IJ91_9ARCH|nr:GH116 family glycosyl hydrolase [Candidatus Nitrosocosmicus franklandus]VFJ14958.1 conserved protein of unknown function [Candidatus Nitrosocosmicus franklandus]